jgi:hypothetical protein
MDATLTQLLQQLYLYSVEIDQLRARVAQLEAAPVNGTAPPAGAGYTPSIMELETLGRA